MALWTMHYAFRQAFTVPAKAAYAWCTDYATDDLPRMGDVGSRRVRYLSDDLVILSDRYLGGSRPVTKEKLVHLMPNKLEWTSTHLRGPTRHSQFLYSIRPNGRRGSYLEFTGLQVEHRRGRATPAARLAAARELRLTDSASWRILAGSLERDIGARRSSPKR